MLKQSALKQSGDRRRKSLHKHSSIRPLYETEMRSGESAYCTNEFMLNQSKQTGIQLAQKYDSIALDRVLPYMPKGSHKLFDILKRKRGKINHQANWMKKTSFAETSANNSETLYIRQKAGLLTK